MKPPVPFDTKTEWMNAVAELALPIWRDQARIRNTGNGRFTISDAFGEEDFSFRTDASVGYWE